MFGKMRSVIVGSVGIAAALWCGLMSLQDIAAQEPVGAAVGALAANSQVAPLTDREKRNLMAFASMYGFARYFAVTDEARATNWERLLHRSVQTLLPVQDDKVLAIGLEELIQPVVPSSRAWLGKLENYPMQPLNISDRNKLTGVRGWVHHGPGPISAADAMFYSEVDSEAMDRSHEPARIARFGFGPTEEVISQFWVRVPTTTLVDDIGTVPRWEGLDAWAYLENVNEVKPPLAQLPRDWEPDPSERSVRLALVIETWNIFKHFYPYRPDVDGLDLNGALEEALDSAATDETRADFLRTLRRLVSHMDDGQSSVTCSDVDESGVLPIDWDWIEDQLVVTAVTSDLNDTVPVGSVVTAIGSAQADVNDVISEAEALVSAATFEARRHGALEAMRRGAPGSAAEFVITVPSGNTKTVQVVRIPEADGPVEARPAPLCQLRPGVMYVDLTRASNDEINGHLDQLQDADGIVFDVRGNVADVRPEYLQHLTDQQLRSDRWQFPIITKPDLVEVTYDESMWILEPREPRFSGKAAFLIDERARGRSESCLGIVEHFGLGDLVGTQTAGCNGDLHSFMLPGGYRVTWTATKVTKRNGNRHYGVGEKPTIPVSRTLDGVRGGRDEVLEAAVRAVTAGAGG